MQTTLGLIGGVFILMAMILLAVILKRTGFLHKDQSSLFSRIVLHVTLPAVVFSSLAVNSFNEKFLLMAVVMLVIELICMAIAWVIGTYLKLKPGEKGALILVSAFGMTTLLGYPVIRQVFPDNPLAMEEAVITSEFGVGFLLFILGPVIAMHYGENEFSAKVMGKSLKNFLSSPLFISLIAGIMVSFIPFDHSSHVFSEMIRFFKLVGNANLLLVAFTLGLIIEFKSEKSIYLFLVIAIIIKLIIKPLLAYWLTGFEGFTEMMRQIVFIETAMPSAILTAVFAKQYNCRPDLVSNAIVVTLILSLASVSLLFILLF